MDKLVGLRHEKHLRKEEMREDNMMRSRDDRMSRQMKERERKSRILGRDSEKANS